MDAIKTILVREIQQINQQERRAGKARFNTEFFTKHPLLCLAMLAGYVLAPAIIRLLFERGQFSADDTDIVSGVLRYGLPQLPFYFSSMVLVSYALSQRRYGLIFWSGIIGCIGKVAGNIALVPLLGINGIALATMFVYGLNASFFWLVLRVAGRQ